MKDKSIESADEIEELKDEGLEAEVEDPAAFQGSNDDAH